MLEFLTKENDRQRAYFDGLFTKTATVLGILIAAVGLVATFVGWNTITGVKQAAENAASTAVAGRLNEIRPQIDQKMKEGVSAEFATSKIDAVVQSAARDATTTTANKLIRSEVREQVSSAVSTEQASIQPILKSAADKAVDQVKVSIQNETDAEVGRIVKDRIEPQLRNIGAFNDEATQNSLARIGIATSLDRLVELSNDPQVLPAVRQTAGADAEAVIRAALTIPAQSGCSDWALSFPEIAVRLKSDDANVLLQTVGCLDPSGYIPKHLKIESGMSSDEQMRLARGEVARLHPMLDQLFQIMTTNHLTTIRVSAFIAFVNIVSYSQVPPPNIQTPNSVLRPLDNTRNTAWWKTHRHEYIR